MRKPFGRLLYLLLVLLAGGCSALGGGKATPVSETPAPQAPVFRRLRVKNQLAVGPALSCKVGEMTTIQTDKAQGDLMAWAPVENQLAYLVPSRLWGWYNGMLMITAYPTKSEIYNGKKETVAGDLTWSPDGQNLAYVILRPSEKIYSAALLTLQTGQEVEMFSASASTDRWASQKSILEWKNARTVTLAASCESACVEYYDYSLNDASLKKSTRVHKSTDTSLKILLPKPTEATKLFPTDVTLYYSPDLSRYIYSDEEDVVWLVNERDMVQFWVAMAGFEIKEAKWSADGKYLALRIEDKIMVYDTQCR